MPEVVRVSSEVLVGRDGELSTTLAALRQVYEGRPCVILVGGPAGVGKTRFATAVADHLRAAGVRVMTGACLDLGHGAPPYAPLIAAFRSVNPPAVQVLDALTGAMPMRRSRLFDLLRSTLVALAHRQLTVLVVEDAHWSDRISRDALLYVLGLAREGRWALLVTYRDTEVAARPTVAEFLDILRREATLSVTLDALTGPEVVVQIASIAGEAPSVAYAERVYRRSGGVPLLVEEVVAADAAGMSRVPDHLRDLFLARVRSLGTAVTAAVEAVAVLGGGAERVVAGVLETDRAKVAEALDRAVAADVLATDANGYRMRHELLQDAVYGALPAGRRRRLHARAAAVLGASPRPDAAALAHHWYWADEPTEAASANLAAAALAARLHAPGEMHRYLERVLEHFEALLPQQARAEGGRAGLLARAAEAAHLSGAFERAVLLAEQSLALPDEPSLMAVRWERLARYCWVNRDGAGAQRAHEQSLEALPDDASAPVRARVLSGYGWYLGMAHRPDEARPWCERALEAADASGQPLERCRALLAWGWSRSDEEAGLAALRAARDLAVACDAGEELARAHGTLGLSLQRLGGRTAEREQVLRDGLAGVAAHGLGRSYEPVIRYLLAETLLDVGRWDEAHELLEEVVARGVVGVPAMFTHADRARLAAARGHTRLAAECADVVAALSAELPQQPLPHSTALAAHAEACLWTGDLADALAYASRAESLASERLVRAEATAVLARAVADACEHARRRGEPVAMPEVTPPAAGAHPRLQAIAAVVRAEKSRRDGRRDAAPWRQAVTAWEAADDPYRAAYCRWRLAHALLATRSGRTEAARGLDAAQRTATQLGARPLLEGVESLAAASRIQLAATPGSSGPARVAAQLGITPRELEILPYLVAGRSNAEIAELLFISPRTVGVHVSRILQKLGATRRTEAADIARRRGLVVG